MTPKINLLGKKTGLSFSKKIFITVTAFACLSVSAFATVSGEETSTKAAQSLKKHYSAAKDIQWKVTSDYTKATFKWNDQHLEVFYNNDGETIAESRDVNITNLPLPALKEINEKYADYKIDEAIELNSEQSGHNYFISLSKNGTKKILQISMDGDISIYKNQR